MVHALRNFISSQRGLVILGIALVGITIALPLIYAQTSNTRSVTAGTATDVACTAPCISTGEIVAGAVTGGAAGVVADNTISTDDILLDTIAAVDIGTGAVGADELAANAVTAAGGELADGVLTADAAGRLKMADGFVNSAEILDNSVAHVDLGDGAIPSTSFTTVVDAAPPINGDIALPDTRTGDDRIVVIATIDITELGAVANDVVLTVSMLGADTGAIAGPTAYTFDLAASQRDSFAAVFFITSANDGVDALANIDVRVAATGFDAGDTLNSFIVVGFALPQTE